MNELVAHPVEPLALQPRHQLVAQRICALIRRQGLRPGDRLPSERNLSRMLGVRHALVRMASDYLAQQGMIVREHGRGTFVRSLDLIGSRKDGGAQAVRLGYLAVGTEKAGYTLHQYQWLERIAREQGVRAVFGAIPPDSGNPLPLSFVEEHVAGLVADGEIDAGFLRRLADLGLPVVVAGNHPIEPGVVHCRMNVVELYRQMVLRLAEAGHQAIWLVSSPPRLYYLAEIIEGYKEGMRAAGLGPELVVLCNDQESPRDRLVEQFMHGYERFGPRQAIFHIGPDRPLVEALAARGVDVDQLDIVATTRGNQPQGELPWTTALHWPIDLVGELAPRMLLKLLRGEQVESINFKPRLQTERVEGHLKLSIAWEVDHRI